MYLRYPADQGGPMNLGYQGGNSSAVPNKPVRVIAVDDHPLTRRGVAEELRDDARL